MSKCTPTILGVQRIHLSRNMWVFVSVAIKKSIMIILGSNMIGAEML